MAGGDIIRHQCDGADGCGVTSSYPAALSGTRVKCPNTECPRSFTLPGLDLPLADPIADEEPPHRYANLPVDRVNRGIEANGQVSWFYNIALWNTKSVTVQVADRSDAR